MTFDDDFVLVNFTGGKKRLRCTDLSIDWPPPEILDIGGFKFTRERYSQITDEERATMSHVCRGAEYNPEEES